MTEARTFIIPPGQPLMRGSDIAEFQQDLNDRLKAWGVNYSVPTDGVYDAATRSLTASVVYGFGLPSAMEALKDGVTPELRIKLRNNRQTPEDKARYSARAGWRRDFAARHASGGQVHTPIAKIIQSSWGWHPGVHDGVDLICNPAAPLFAICDGVIIDARSGGWWGLGAPKDPAIKAKGDGIIQLRCTVDVGPFKTGLVFAYGHAEGATVKVGDHVKAGELIGHAGLANAWHTHFMVHDATEGTRGVGDRDPMPFVRYAQEH